MNIQWKIIAGVIAVLVSSICVTEFITINYSTSVLRKKIEDNMILLAEGYADDLNTRLVNYKKTVQILACSVINTIKIEDVLISERSLYPEFEQLLYIHSSGQLIDLYPENSKFMDLDFSTKPYWIKVQTKWNKRTANGRWDVFVKRWEKRAKTELFSQSIVISQPNNDFGYPAIIISAPVPVFYDANSIPDLQGVIMIIIPLDKLLNKIGEINVGNTGTLFVLDQNGFFLSYRNIEDHQSTECILKHKLSDSGTDKNLKFIESAMIQLDSGVRNYSATYTDSISNKVVEREKFIVFAPVKVTGWSVGITGDLSEFTHHINHLIIIIVVIMCVCLFFALIFIFLIIRKVIKPVFNLLETISLVENGNLTVEAKVESNDEIGLLASAFNRMTFRLRTLLDDIKQSEKKYRGIFENATDGIFQATPDRKLLTANPALAKIFGFHTPAELISSVNEMGNYPEIDPKDKESFNNLIRENGAVFGMEVQIIPKNGNAFWASLSAKAIYDTNKKLLYFEGTLVDITERMQIEKVKMERESAEAATLAKSNFLASMSHEIRTPMNAIMGLSELALKTDLTVRQKDYLEKILSSASNLLAIVNDILDFSKIEAGKMELETVDFQLFDIFDNLSNVFYLNTAKKGVELVVSFDKNVPWNLRGDPLRLGQILTNLTSNAIKFTVSGQIVISVSVVKKEPELVRLCFAVSNSGVGIPEEKLPLLFKSFSQTDDNTSRRYGGTGLGLNICKRLSEMMNGRIWVESKEDKKTTFLFEVEFGISVKKDSMKHVAPVYLQNLNILLADDNAVVRNIMVKMLTSLLFKVTCVASGEDALKKLKQPPENKPFDLFITDWKMPGLDGLETSKRIRKERNLARIPIIMMSAFDKDGIASELAGAIEVDAFLTKPVTPVTLLKTIISVFAHEVINQLDDEQYSLEKVKKNKNDEAINAIKGAKILIVDDNEINRLVAIELLEGADFVTDEVVDGKEAVQAVLHGNYDAVLMDIQMPVMDGYEATQKIRELGQSDFDGFDNTIQQTGTGTVKCPKNEIPIIAMTAHALAGTKEQCIDAGMSDFTTKPIIIDQLFATLVKWIKPGIRDINISSNKPAMVQSDETLAEFSEKDVEIKEIAKLEKITELNVSLGLERVNGNLKLYKDLLTKFLNSNRDVIQQIKLSLDNKEFENAANIAHTLKGVSGNIGAEEIFFASKDMEFAIRQGKVELYGNLLGNLEEKMSNIITSIDNQIAFDHNNKEDTFVRRKTTLNDVDISNIKPVIIELLTLLKKNYSSAVDRIEDMKNLVDADTYNDLMQMENYVNDLEFEPAVVILEGIAKKFGVTCHHNEI